MSKISDLIQKHNLITGSIIEAEMKRFDHTLEILITELAKIDKEIKFYFAQNERKAEFV